MKSHSPVLSKFADMYEKSAAGRHGVAKLDFQPDFEFLLRSAGCAEGESRDLAERELLLAEQANIIQLEYDRPRTRSTALKVRMDSANEHALFYYLGRKSPTECREQWVALFEEATSWPVPLQHAEEWRCFCHRRADAARHWRNMKPFKREDAAGGRELLLLVTRLLAWQGRHLVRWVSSILCNDSKLLERRQSVLERLMKEATENNVSGYEALEILAVPPGVVLHGPVRLRIGDSWRDFRNLNGPSTLSGADVERITAVECDASRCLTVENGNPFHSLATLGSGELLIHTTYPNEATVAFLILLAKQWPAMDFWHFGDTDPAGFHILFDLRSRSGIPFRAFHMLFRHVDGATPLSRRERELLADLMERMPSERRALEEMLASGRKGDFEQESLPVPALTQWPFY